MNDGILDTELVRLAILGGGPIGLEAALYARYLGYSVVVFEQHAAIGQTPQLRDPPGFAQSWRECTTPLGLAAIDAHQEPDSGPATRGTLTWPTYIADYLRPLSQTDLVADTVQCGQRVVSVRPAQDAELVTNDDGETGGAADPEEELDGPSHELPWGGLAEEDREWTARPWCVTTVNPDGRTSQSWFDCVIDAAGVDRGSAGAEPDWSWYGDLPLTLDPSSLALPLLTASGLSVERAVRWSEISPQMPLGGGGALSLGHAGLFVLGSKSYGRLQHFQLADGYAQICDLFAWLGGRRQLDLYRCIRP